MCCKAAREGGLSWCPVMKGELAELLNTRGDSWKHRIYLPHMWVLSSSWLTLWLDAGPWQDHRAPELLWFKFMCWHSHLSSYIWLPSSGVELLHILYCKMCANTHVLYLNELCGFILQMVDISSYDKRFRDFISEISVTSNKQLSPWQVNHSIISSNLCSH